mgnify:FL=1
MDNHRAHLGYSECVECSTIKKYSSHTIYPHKTGGYIQPVSEEQSENLNRLDRRGMSGNKAAKGIVADKSWDRFLENYLNPEPPRKKYIPKPVTNVYIPIKEAMKEAMKKFDTYGYNAACELTQSLYSNDKISLIQKSKIINELSNIQMMSAKERKFIKKLQNKSWLVLQFYIILRYEKKEIYERYKT